MKLIPPAEGIEGKLADVQANLKKITGHPASDETLMAVAQTQATCALVHAVRELTEEIRKTREGPATTLGAIIEEHRARLAAEATTQRMRAFFEDMRTWCSPLGVAADYAERGLAALDAEQPKETP